MYLAAVSFLHHSEGLQSPVRGNQILRLLLRGIRRSNLASSPKSCCRHPITPGILVKQLSSSHTSRSPWSQDKRMFQATAALAFFGFLQIGEFTATPHRPVSLSEGDINLIRNNQGMCEVWGVNLGWNPTGLTYLGDPSLGSILAWYAGHPVGDQHHHLVPVSPRPPTRPDYLWEPKPQPAVGLGTWGILLVTSVTIGYPVTRADRGTPNE